MSLNKKPSSGKNGKTPSTKPTCDAGEAAPIDPITVAIGASAGGLEALEQLFNGMPADQDLCFVVIMHHPPDAPLLLPGILSRHTAMQVVIATEGMPLLPNTVCVIPATYGLILRSGRVCARCVRAVMPSASSH